MPSSAERAGGKPAGDPGAPGGDPGAPAGADPARPAAPGPAPAARPGHGLATACLVAGIAGFTLVTIVPALLCGVLGLRQASRAGPRGAGAGQVRCWAGIGLALIWAVTGIYLAPRLVRAADPGCAAYKGTALTAYNRVISDLGGPGENPAGARSGDGSKIMTDLPRAITALNTAAARSHSATTKRDLSRLTTQLRQVLADIRAGTVVPATALTALNADAARADTACGTLRV
jgi:hypothetical protein